MRPRQLMPRSRESEASSANGEEHTRYQLVPDPIAIYACNASGEITYFNDRAAELWGRRPLFRDTNERFCGAYMLFRPDGSHMPHEKCPMADVLSGKLPGVLDAEVQIERPDGSRVSVIVNIVPLIQDGKPTGAINSFYDVTDRSYVQGMHRTAARASTITTRQSLRLDRPL